jgi:hypothetical protein
MMAASATAKPLRECAPSGYNCNILITLTRQGSLTVAIDASLPYYPPTQTTNGGQLIGFKNSSNAPVYSLSFKVKPGVTGSSAFVCAPLDVNVANAPNVRIINIPWGPNIGSNSGPWYYFYSLPPPYAPSTIPWATSCDVIFEGGVPKGGSIYFSLGGNPPNSPQWNVTVKNVVAFVQFREGIAQGETADATVTLYPPSPVEAVTLNLAPSNGTGSAVFTSTNSATTTVNQSGPVGVKGADASSVHNNIELKALVGGDSRGRATFTVVDTTLTCTSPVTRGQSSTCQPNTAPTNATYTWKFTDGSGNVVTPNNNTGTWQGIMVTSGTVDLTIDGVALVPTNITVSNRTNFAFTAVAPTQLQSNAQLMSNTITCYDGTTHVLQSPPAPFSLEGYSCADMAFDPTPAQVADGGPNHGYRYVSSVADAFQGLPTRFAYIVVTDLLDPTSTFHAAQCGTFSASNQSGFIAGSQLKDNVFNHEQGSVLSHWTEYRDAQDNPSNNVGALLEMVVGPPGISQVQFDQSVRDAGNNAIARIAQAVAQEPCSGAIDRDSSQSCKYCGTVNYAPYQSCGGATPVPYCQ